ncbi:SusC/RagA family TonB-linked outer membrane protein [Sphingobacterium spiritivorum]|nr:SusC/RagA family TonB-linked outer membrane protein [Sphingobacterium spiritivorum]
MKLIPLLLFAFMFHVNAHTFGQNINLKVRNEQLINVLKEIQRQSGYNFLFNSHFVKISKPVSVAVANENINDALTLIFQNQPFDFVITDKIITVKAKESVAITSPNTMVQQKVITGRVVDQRGQPLSGVTVTELETNNSTATNNDGAYRLTLRNNNATLQFNLLGFGTIRRKATDNVLNVSLTPSDIGMDEVVVTGFQKLDKRKFTGSVSQVDKNVIDRSGAIDVSRMLQGAAAGVSVQNTSGTFGSTPKIRIRGNSSISANQEPLYVINGVPITSPSNVAVSQLYSGDPASVLGSAIAGLNAQDIEDIVILKDGAATALYGTRAANGVISITTKSGAYNQRNINFSTALSLGIKPNIKNFNLMNSQEEMGLYKQMYDMGYLSNANWPTYTGAYTETYKQLALRNINLDQAYAELNKSTMANTDWFDVLFRNNVVQEHSLSFNGGSDKNTYYLSGSYAHDDGQAIGYNMDRFTVDARNVFNITSKLKLDVNLNWSYRDQFTPGTYNSTTTYSDISRQFEINPFLYAMNTSRTMYPYNEDGSYKYYTENLAPFNIIEELKENFTQVKSQDIKLNIRPSYQITKALRYDLTLSLRKTNNSYDHTVTERSNVANAYRVDYNDVLRGQNTLLYQDPADPNGYKETILPRGGFLYARSNWGKNLYIRNQLNFNKKWSKHAVDALAGMEISSDRIDRQYTKGIGYLYYGGKIISPSKLAMIHSVNTDDRVYIESFENENRTGYYANVQYSFLERYNIEAGGRMDASNMFGRMTRSKFLPNYSVGVSWNIDREDFFKKGAISETVDYLKLRGSYALRGNAYQSSPLRSAAFINKTRLDAQNSDIGVNVSSPELYNLNWEKDYIKNVGLEFGLFDKLTFVGEYYDRKNKDLIATINVAQEEGFETKTVNFASMTNRGVDLTIGIKNILNKEDLKWDANFIYGYVKNNVIGGELESSLLTQITRSNGYPLNGKPYEGLYAFRFAGLNEDGRPTFWKGDQRVTGIIASEKDRSLIEYMGTRQPLGTGSLSNSVQYKGFEFRIFITYAYGHKVFMSPIAARSYDDSGSKSADLNYRWQTIGDENYTNVPGLLSTIQRTYLGTVSNIDEVAYNRSNFRVADASVIRLNEVMVSYELGRLINKKYPFVKNARIILSGNNLYYKASDKLRGVDPELLLTGGTSLPNPRSYSLRLTVGF